MRGKKFLLMLVPTRNSPLTTRAVWTYSHLVYRSRKHLGATKSQLQEITGLHSKTVKAALLSLLEHQLAVEKNGAFFAKDDAAGLFHRKKKQVKKWQDTFQSVKVYLLSPEQTRLTFTENLVLWLVHSYNTGGRKIRRKGIATHLGIAADTAKRATKHLRSEGLLDDAWNLTINAAARAIWADQPQPEDQKAVDQSNFILATRVIKQFREDYRPQFDKAYPAMRDNVKELIRAMKDADYGSQHIADFLLKELPAMCGFGPDQHPAWPSLFLDCYLNRCVWQAFEAAEKFTVKNRVTGKFHGPNSLGVFRTLSQSALRLMKARLVDEGVDGVRRMTPRFDKFLGLEA